MADTAGVLLSKKGLELASLSMGHATPGVYKGIVGSEEPIQEALGEPPQGIDRELRGNVYASGTAGAPNRL